jgi:hypothetical protein
MTKRIHFAAAMLAFAFIATFFLSTVIVELFGEPTAIALVKSLIVFPGLFILVPALAATGGSGFALSKSSHGAIVDAK